MASAPVKITAARTEQGYLVRVEGWGTMRDSPVLREWADLCLAEQDGSLAVDLSACDYLDSTFLGCLVGLHRDWQRGSRSFYIVADAESRRRLLEPLRLDQIFSFAESAGEPLGEWLTLCSATMDPPDLGRHVLACHSRLVELGGKNQEVFGPIVERLAKELHEVEQSKHGERSS